MNQHYLSDKDFFDIYSKVPRFNLDLVIKSEQGILLALRTIEPSKGFWHLPGGTVYKGEKIVDAALRIAKKETGLTVSFDRDIGYTEFPNEVRSGVNIHTICIVIQVTPVDGTLQHDENAAVIRYWKELPEKIVSEHGVFLKNHDLFSK